MKRLEKLWVGFGIFVVSTVSTAMAATDSDELAFAETMAEWAAYAHEVRIDSGPENANRDNAVAQMSLLWHEAFHQLMQMRPDLATPETPRTVILDYALGLVKRYAPEHERLVTDEFDQLRAGSTLGLLRTIAKALDAYLINENVFPTSGNLSLVTGLINGQWSYLALPEGRFDADGRILDDWRRPIVYVSVDGQSYTLYSTGPNGEDDGGAADDLAISWP